VRLVFGYAALTVYLFWGGFSWRSLSLYLAVILVISWLADWHDAWRKSLGHNAKPLEELVATKQGPAAEPGSKRRLA
jgi:hypothetical protein